MKALPPLCLMLFISLFSTSVFSALGCITKKDATAMVNNTLRNMPPNSEVAKVYEKAFYQAHKKNLCQNQPPLNTKKQIQVATKNTATPILGSSKIIHIGTVESSFHGIDVRTGRYRIKTELGRNPQRYCGMGYINLNPGSNINIPTKIINEDGIKISPQVRLKNVTKKGHQCYFESITVLKPKNDKRITLDRAKTTANFSGSGARISIEKNHPTLIKEMPRCTQGPFQRRLKGNQKYPLIPKIPQGSIIRMVVSLQGSQCTYEKIEFIK